jgi:hypothetical protein
MLAFAWAHDIPLVIELSRFMPGHAQFVVGEGKKRRVLHSPARVWRALRAAADTRPISRRITAKLRGAVMGIKLVK